MDSSSDNDILDNSEDLGSLSEFDDSDTVTGIRLHGRAKKGRDDKVKVEVCEGENISRTQWGDRLVTRKKKGMMILMGLSRFWKELSRALLWSAYLTSL